MSRSLFSLYRFIELRRYEINGNDVFGALAFSIGYTSGKLEMSGSFQAIVGASADNLAGKTVLKRHRFFEYLVCTR
jgi:hypothetical protein